MPSVYEYSYIRHESIICQIFMNLNETSFVTDTKEKQEEEKQISEWHHASLVYMKCVHACVRV